MFTFLNKVRCTADVYTFSPSSELKLLINNRTCVVNLFNAIFSIIVHFYFRYKTTFFAYKLY